MVRAKREGESASPGFVQVTITIAVAAGFQSNNPLQLFRPRPRFGSISLPGCGRGVLPIRQIKFEMTII